MVNTDAAAWAWPFPAVRTAWSATPSVHFPRKNEVWRRCSSAWWASPNSAAAASVAAAAVAHAAVVDAVAAAPLRWALLLRGQGPRRSCSSPLR